MIDTKAIMKKLKSAKSLEIEFALDEIDANLSGNSRKIKDLMQHSVLQRLVSLVENPRFCKICLRIIATACLERACVDKIIEHNGIKSIRQAILSSSDYDTVNLACRAVGNISKIRKHTFLGKDLAHLISHIVKFLESSNVNLWKITAVRTLRILGEDIKARKIILRNSGITYIAGLLRSSDEKLVLESIRALAKLTKYCSFNYTYQFLKRRSLKSVVDLYDLQDHEIRMHVIVTLKNISGLQSTKDALVEAGGVKLFIKVATHSKSIEKKKLALLGLCYTIDDCRNDCSSFKAIENGLLKVFVEALTMNIFKDIHIVIFTSLLCIVENSPNYCKELINLGLISLLIHALKNFTKDHNSHDESASLRALSSIENPVIGVDNSDRKSKKLICAQTERKKKLLKVSHQSNKNSRNVLIRRDGSFKTEECAKVNSACMETCEKDNFDRKSKKRICIQTEKKNKLQKVSHQSKENSQNALTGKGECFKTEECAKVNSACMETHKNDNSCRKSNKRICVETEKENKLLKVSYLLSSNNFQYTPTTIDYLILSLLLHLTHYSKNESNSSLADKSCFSTLMFYLLSKPNAESKAEKILLEIIKNRHSFEKMIVQGFVSSVDEILISNHDHNFCNHCTYIQTVHDTLISAVRVEGESEFGIGTLGHILHYSKNVDLYNTLYAVSKLIHLKPALYKLFPVVLEKICSILKKNSNFASENLIICLCKFYQNLKMAVKSFPSKCCISQNCSFGASPMCIYKDDVTDVTFVVDNGVEICASLEKLCENSDYFGALLNGHFREKNQSVVAIHEISAEILTVIFHFLHGCNREHCPFVNKISFESSLELLVECEKFLLNDIKNFAIDKLCHFLLPETAVEIYQIAETYNSTSLMDITLNYLLCLDVSENVSIKCLQEFLKLGNDFQVVDQIKKYFYKYFYLKSEDYKS